MMIFNSIISHLALIELPLKGRSFTWSDMQDDPLLEQLDWFFTTTNWTITYPKSEVLAFAKNISDHVACVVSVGTSIPHAKIFRFENFWVQHPGFKDIVLFYWNLPVRASNSAMITSVKLKNLRRGLKLWSKNISCLSWLIKNCNDIIMSLGQQEEHRSLVTIEWNFRIIIKRHLLRLLKYNRFIGKQRCTIRWVKFVDENTKFFHAMATDRYRRNAIPRILLLDGRVVSYHNSKAAIFGKVFRDRMGESVISSIQ